MFGADDINTAFNDFHNTFSFYCNLQFPLKKFKRCNAKSWENREIKLSSDSPRDMYRLSRELPFLRRDYVLAKNRHRALVESTKKSILSSPHSGGLEYSWRSLEGGQRFDIWGWFSLAIFWLRTPRRWQTFLTVSSEMLP